MDYNKKLIAHLRHFVSENRYDTFLNVLSNRTRHISIVLEDIYQPQNASAVLRSADGFGFQDVHIIENNHEYRINPDVEKGASKWLSMHRYEQNSNSTRDCLDKLKSNGYRIVATTPHTNNVKLEDFDVLEGKSAIVFGTEVTGISDLVMQEADTFLKIPMYGFTESYNISVSAAVIMSQLRVKLNHSDMNWHLSEKQTDEVMIDWLKKTIKSSRTIINRFEKEYCK